MSRQDAGVCEKECSFRYVKSVLIMERKVSLRPEKEWEKQALGSEIAAIEKVF